MKRFFKFATSLLLAVSAAAASAAPEVRLAVTGSFSLPKEIIARFEQQNNVTVAVIKAGSANEMLNKLIITRKNPIADAVYGLDNVNVAKAKQRGVLAAKQPAGRVTLYSLPYANAVDYGYVTVNYDKAWFAKNRKPLPKTLADLASPAYKNLLVVPSPATSGPGLGFLAANIGALGEAKAFQWWADMRRNGVKVAKGWSDAYYTDFTLNGGNRPLMVGYATSPAAEVFYSKGKLKTPPTGSLMLPGGVFRQVEGAAVLAGAKEPALAAKLVQYLQGVDVQKAVAPSMWVYPAVKGIVKPVVLAGIPEPAAVRQPSPAAMAAGQQKWVRQWTRTVLR